MSDHVEPNFGRQALLTYDHSHDTFVWENHRNFLVGNAGVGAYVHGRIHQQFGVSIYVGDMIHKRGPVVSDDLLLMEEQALLSMGEPLSTNSKLGSLVALAVLPTMNTANGEGDLIAYYQNGVVSYDTLKAPRETRHDGEGKVIQKGWDSMRLVSHLLNTVSAVSRYAVAVLTRDHFFRSRFGLHFLKTVLGEGTFNSENVNRISMDVETILAGDTDLSGAACGFWPEGHRMFATTGLVSGNSSSSVGRGFVSWNQALTYTEDRTPVAAWEGLWNPDKGVQIHKFDEWNGFGFICSVNEQIYFAQIDPTLDVDRRDGKDMEIPWSFETARFMPSGMSKKSIIKGLTLEATFSGPVVIKIRTDVQGTWQVWKNFTPKGFLLLTESIGSPPQSCKECTWVQVRVEGVGYCELNLIDLDYSDSVVKTNRSQSYKVEYKEEDLWSI